MPHLIFEYSDNIIEKNNWHDLFLQCHSLLEETLPTDLVNCKSRAMECKNFLVGNGQAHNAFIHLDLKILPGRSTSTLQDVGNKMLVLLSKYFAESLKLLDLQISLEISELQATYFKVITQK